MSVTQIVDIPDTSRITIDVPSEVPAGRVSLQRYFLLLSHLALSYFAYLRWQE